MTVSRRSSRLWILCTWKLLGARFSPWYNELMTMWMLYLSGCMFSRVTNAWEYYLLRLGEISGLREVNKRSPWLLQPVGCSWKALALCYGCGPVLLLLLLSLPQLRLGIFLQRSSHEYAYFLTWAPKLQRVLPASWGRNSPGRTHLFSRAFSLFRSLHFYKCFLLKTSVQSLLVPGNFCWGWGKGLGFCGEGGGWVFFCWCFMCQCVPKLNNKLLWKQHVLHAFLSAWNSPHGFFSRSMQKCVSWEMQIKYIF